jgi:hypothetical protein
MVESVYLLSYFLGNGESGAYLAVSDDGWCFSPLVEPTVPVIAPAVGPDKLMRDPCLAQGPDGLWHLVWTTGWWDRHIGYATSPDLLHWSEQRLLPVMAHEPTALNAWAPELVYEPQGKRWVLYWSTTIPGRFPETDPEAGPDASASGKPLNHRFYFSESHDNGATWSGARLLWDPGFNCIDATIVPDGESWLLIGKDETRVPQAHKWLFVARGASATGPFEMIAPRITGDYWAEGPTALKIANTWRVYFDRYQEDTWGAAESDDGIHWHEASEKLQMVPGARHGMVVTTTRPFIDTLRKALL